MVFVSKNIFRKCKYCEKEKKKNISGGRNKGYCTTCGSPECLRRQYDDFYVCGKKARLLNPQELHCVLCNNKFERVTTAKRIYCFECVPDKSWRGRAQRYGIGKKQWNILLEKQNHTCALCDKNPEVVDHCHSKGIVRGLLCNSCNIGLKILDSCPDFLQRAIKYVGVLDAFQK